MIHMVPNLEPHSNQVPDTRTRPQIRGEPCGLRSRQGRSLHFLSLPRRKLGRSPRHGLRSQRLVPPLCAARPSTGAH
jgi:hypothetical protein